MTPVTGAKAPTRVHNGVADDHKQRPAEGDATAVVAQVLKDLVQTLSKQSSRQADVVGAFGDALRDLGRELQQAQARIAFLEAEVRHAEDRAERLEQTVSALARQGWIQ